MSTAAGVLAAARDSLNLRKPQRRGLRPVNRGGADGTAGPHQPDPSVRGTNRAVQPAPRAGRGSTHANVMPVGTRLAIDEPQGRTRGYSGSACSFLVCRSTSSER